jgi:uncharacterized repeat protein (TIGR01451 family)
MVFLLNNINFIQPTIVKAGPNDGYDLAMAILADQTTYVSSSYYDLSKQDNQGMVLFSLGNFNPTNGPTFVILSTGIAGANPATTDTQNPGNERGTWFRDRYSKPFDQVDLTINVMVPPFMHYLYYDFQFFSTEYPEYINSQYNDKFEVTVDSPSRGVSTYVCDINSANFVLDSNDISGTGFDIFAQSGYPDDTDIVDKIPRFPGADAGATAPITNGGELHPISPNEIITVTFSIRDVGDNQFDSAVLIDNLMFSGFGKTEISAKKTVEDLNGGLCEQNDTLQYSITISNSGTLNQSDFAGNEFEDIIPENTLYILNSSNASSGVIAYDDNSNMITWNGEIPSKSSVSIKFNVTVDPNCDNNVVISNQGKVFYDKNESHTNNAIEYTDDPNIDDYFDLDEDGKTYDDDATNITVMMFEAPSYVIEDFSDDSAGGNATQSYYLRKWFNTSEYHSESSFEVASSYYYSTPYSFKTKIRSTTEDLYWNYNLSILEQEIKSWEIWFKCGNASDDADLFLTFKNNAEQDIVQIKFNYVQNGSDNLTNWLAQMYYKTNTGWNRLYTGIAGYYLYNGWYKLKIENKDTNNIILYLYNSKNQLVHKVTTLNLNASFSNLEKIIWNSTKNPIQCPIFFWDEHRLEFI